MEQDTAGTDTSVGSLATIVGSGGPLAFVEVLTLGAVFKPIEPIAIKIDWQRRRNAARTGINQWNVGLGYLF